MDESVIAAPSSGPRVATESMAAAIDPGERVALRDSQEFQSALIRFPLGLAALVFLAAGHLTGQSPVHWPQAFLLYTVHLAVFLALFAWVIARPGFHRWRSDLSIAADLSAATSLIWLSGDPVSPLYLIYVVLFLSQGTRYGTRNLLLSATGSILCFLAVTALMGGWSTHPVELSFVLVGLAVLPLYHHRLVRTLQASRRRAEIATEARGDFLATMSHELRTPLSGIIGMARLLERTDLDHEQRRCVDSICSSGDTLQVLIGDILDLSKIDAGGLELHPDHFDLRRSVLDVCRNVGQDALAKSVEVVCCIDGTLPEIAHGDRVRFEQILYNIVGNAVKFTPAGRVCVDVERSSAHADLAVEHVEVVIGDTGIGIPRDRIDSIFESFWQADTRASRHCGGTGLGTTIAHRLTRAMGGHISAESEEGQGSTFRLRLPLLPEARLDHPLQPPPALRGRTVLVHEHDPEARSALEESCRQAGMAIISCSDDAELTRQLPAHGDAVEVALVADTPLGLDLEGVAAHLCERLGREVPILYVGYSGRLAGPQARIAPAVGKPWHPAELWCALEQALGAPGAAKSAAEDSGTPEDNGTVGPEDTVRARHRANTRILVIEDDAVNAGLVETLLGRFGFSATVVGDGPSGLECMAAQRFDLLLVDLRMPGMDGLEFTRHVRAREDSGRRLPIVALTANVAADVHAKGLAAGMDEVLTKPVDAETLEQLIEHRVARAG